jgi:hypothetical protein
MYTIPIRAITDIIDIIVIITAIRRAVHHLISAFIRSGVYFPPLIVKSRAVVCKAAVIPVRGRQIVAVTAIPVNSVYLVKAMLVHHADVLSIPILIPIIMIRALRMMTGINFQS